MKDITTALKPTNKKNRYHCPACGKQNLTVNGTTGAYSCWNGCSTDDIKDAITAQYPDFFKKEKPLEKSPRECKVTEYIYTDREGNPLIKVKKTVTGEYGQDKDIKQFHWTGRLWKFGYGEIETSDIPLYRYTEAMTAIEEGKSIVLCEGESTADAFWDKGIPATTTIGGTGKSVIKSKEVVDKEEIIKFKRNLKTFESIKPALADLSEAKVILAPDQDKPGCLHMEMMAELLNVEGWLYAFPGDWQWTRLKDKGGIDLVDWIYCYPKLTKEEILGSIVSEPAHTLHSRPQTEQLPLSFAVNVQPSRRPSASTLAKKLHEIHPHLIYVADRKVWMMYEASTKGVWEEIPEELIERLVMQLLERTGYGELDKFTLINNTIKFLRAGTPAFTNKWEEADTNLLPFSNGVLDLRTREFSGHDPKHHCTWALPRPHDPLADQWKNIDAWLDFATQGKAGLRTILECFAAAVLKGRSDLQKFLHLMGIGGSGKGTYMKLLTSLIGDNNVVVSNLQRFCTNNFEASRIQHKRLVLFADEREKPQTIRDLLSLTGQDPLTAEKKRKDAFNFTYQGMVALASEAPIFYGEMGEGLRRRLILMPMNARVKANERRDLQADFESELAAFTNHLLSLPDDFVSEVLKNTRENIDIQAYYWKARLREDSIAAWIDERIIQDSEAEISYAALYENYKAFCQEAHTQIKSKNKFSAELPEVCKWLQWEYCKHKTANGRVVKGLRFRTAEDDSLYPSLDSPQTPPSDEAKMTTLMTTCDDLDDDLKSDDTRIVTTMTTCSNLVEKNKKTEVIEDPDLVKNDTGNTEKLSSDYHIFRNEINDDFLKSKTSPSRVGEKAFKAKFSDPETIEKYINVLEKHEKLICNHGYIYNAYGLVFKKGEEVIYKGKDGGKYCGKIATINFPYYTIYSSKGQDYVHCLDIKKIS